jgi:hypothetical protein
MKHVLASETKPKEEVISKVRSGSKKGTTKGLGEKVKDTLKKAATFVKEDFSKTRGKASKDLASSLTKDDQ